MREPYAEGLATHGGPESCGDAREGVAEALTGVHVGRVLSRERSRTQGAEGVGLPEGNTGDPARGEGRWTGRGRRPRACMEAPCARTGRSRDCPEADGAWGRGGKSKDAIHR